MEENKKVMVEEEPIYTLKNFGKATRKYWIMVSAVSLGALLVGYLGWKIAIQPSRKTYTTEFGLTINVDDNNRLADGSSFSYTDIVSESSVYEVKERSEDYKNIDVDKMLDKSAISIRQKSYTNATTNEEVFLKPAQYILQVTGDYFDSKQVAKSFMMDLLNVELEKIAIANNNYSVELIIPNNFADLDSVTQCDTLLSQYNAMVDAYEVLLSKTGLDGHAAINEDGTTLATAYNSYKNDFASGASTVFDMLTSKATTMHFVSDYDSTKVTEMIEDYKIQGAGYIEALRINFNSIETYSKLLDQLVQTQIAISINSDDETTQEENAIVEKITEYSKKVVELKAKTDSLVKALKYLGYVVPTNVNLSNIDSITLTSGDGVIQFLQSGTIDATWEAKNAQFNNEVVSYKDKLRTQRMLFTQYYTYAHNHSNNRVIYYSTNGMEYKNGPTSLIGAGVGVIMGFVVSEFVAAGLLASKKNKKEETK